MKIIFAGNNLRAYECLNYLVQKKISPSLVVAHYKKDKSDYFMNLKPLSTKLKINCITPKNINSNISKKIFRKIKPDLMILCGYSQNILKKNILKIPRFGTWNLHASDLPKYRGAAPLNWAIINNEKKVGISIIQVDETIDGGDIIKKKIIKVQSKDNIKSLTEKINQIYPKLLFEEIIKLKKGKIKKIKQNHNNATYFTKRFPKDSYLDFENLTAFQIRDISRASTYPYAPAYFFYKKKKFTINAKIRIMNNFFGIPGRIIKRNNNSVIIICKEHAIRMDEIMFKNQPINPIKFRFKVGTNVN